MQAQEPRQERLGVGDSTLEPFTWVMVGLSFVMVLCMGLSNGEWSALLGFVAILLVICMLILWRCYDLLRLLVHAIYGDGVEVRADLLALLQRLRRQIREQ